MPICHDGQAYRAGRLAIDHLHQPLRLRDLSRAVSLSPFHFNRVFYALVGATPIELKIIITYRNRDRSDCLSPSARNRSLTKPCLTLQVSAPSWATPEQDQTEVLPPF